MRSSVGQSIRHALIKTPIKSEESAQTDRHSYTWRSLLARLRGDQRSWPVGLLWRSFERGQLDCEGIKARNLECSLEFASRKVDWTKVK